MFVDGNCLTPAFFQSHNVNILSVFWAFTSIKEIEHLDPPCGLLCNNYYYPRKKIKLTFSSAEIYWLLITAFSLFLNNLSDL